MCNESALASVFGPFAGSEIAVIDAHTPDPQDPVFNKMQQVAEDHGYTLRLVWSDRLTTGYDPKRANIRMENQFDGKWRVSSHFHMG